MRCLAGILNVRTHSVSGPHHRARGRAGGGSVPLVHPLGDAGEPEGGEGDVKVPLGNREGAARMLAVLLHVFGLRGNACAQHSEVAGQVSDITQSSVTSTEELSVVLLGGARRE